MLKIENLSLKVEDKELLNDFNLNIKDGEIHAIMGPNGIGKSSICKSIMGDSKYIITCLINLTADNIASLKDIILADDFDFTSINELDTVINTYNYHLFLLSYLNSKFLVAHREFISSTEVENKDEMPTNELGEDRNIILSSNDYNNMDKKSYIERDLDDLPEECFSRVRELLTNFKVGNNSGFVIKKLVDIPDTYEIKDSDQIRVVFSKKTGNNYIIKGVFQKKGRYLP